jgi:hypothetical protein
MGRTYTFHCRRKSKRLEIVGCSCQWSVLVRSGLDSYSAGTTSTTLPQLCQNYMTLCVRISKLTHSASNVHSGEGNACSSRSDSIFLSFRHSKQLQSQKNAIYFLDLAVEERIRSPLLLSFDCVRDASESRHDLPTEHLLSLTRHG